MFSKYKFKYYQVKKQREKKENIIDYLYKKVIKKKSNNYIINKTTNVSKNKISDNKKVQCIVKYGYSIDNIAIKEHRSYIEREGAGENKEKPIINYIKKSENEKIKMQYRFIISTKKNLEENELKKVVNEFVKYINIYIDKYVENIYYTIHYNTEHRHIHLAIELNKIVRLNQNIVKKDMRKYIEKYIIKEFGYCDKTEKRVNINDIVDKEVKENSINKELVGELRNADLIEDRQINGENKIYIKDDTKEYFEIKKRFAVFERIKNKYKSVKVLKDNEEIIGKVFEIKRIDENSDKNAIIVITKNKDIYFVPLYNKFKGKKNDIVKIKNTKYLSRLGNNAIEIIKEKQRNE